MTEKINMKKGETNNNVPQSNTLRIFNTSIPNALSSNSWSFNISRI